VHGNQEMAAIIFYTYVDFCPEFKYVRPNSQLGF